MNYQTEIGNSGNLIPIPDVICQELGIELGDILLCEAVASSSGIVMTKHSDQTLNDAEIASAGNLTRVVSLTDGS